jgi:hypothetical protein
MEKPSQSMLPEQCLAQCVAHNDANPQVLAYDNLKMEHSSCIICSSTPYDTPLSLYFETRG